MKFKNKINLFVFSNNLYFINSLIKNNENIIGICCSKKTKSLFNIFKDLFKYFLIKINFFWKDCFELYKNPLINNNPIQKLANKNNIILFNSKKIRSETFRQELIKANPDYIFVCGFGSLIPKNIINIKNKFIINFHPSLLPKHRGGTPNRWVIRNGETLTGVTAHFVDEKFDTGEIIMQKKFSIQKNCDYGQLQKLSDYHISIMIKKLLIKLKSKKLISKKQNQKYSSYEKSFRSKDAIIDWNLSSNEIKRICYSIKPLSGGITKIYNNKFCLWEVEEIKRKNNYEPGKIIQIDNLKNILVGCGKNILKIKKFLYAGKAAESKKIVNKFNIKKGMKFY